MLRAFLLYLSRAQWAKSMTTNFGFARRTARRFVAGETLDEGIEAVRVLNSKGIKATLDHLGENVTNLEEATRAADDYVELLERIASSGIDSSISVKLTQLGLDLGDEPALENMKRILAKAVECGTFVCIDMESSDYTERTLRIYRTLRDEYGYKDLRTVIQAYLYRSEDDMRALAEEGAHIRLCKGAYKEPPDIAFPRKADVDANYLKLAKIFLNRQAIEKGARLAVATHDEKIIRQIEAHVHEQGIKPDEFEFQMLHGIRTDLQESLAREGYQVRIYVPYGDEWYPYFMRRLAERPANLWFFASNFFRR